MFDILVLWMVWLSAIAVLLFGVFHLNDLPRGGCLWVQLQKIEYLVLLSGALCIVLSPLYGWGWSIYGGHLIAISVGLMVTTKMLRAYCASTSSIIDNIFDVLE